MTYIHPCHGVKFPTVPATVRTIITPEQFDAIYAALPDPDSQLLVETAIESGLRWGELTELRVKDLDPVTRMLTVSRKVIELNRDFHPDGCRFLVKLYPKDKEYRRLKISQQIAAKIAVHISARNLGPEDLIFARRVPTQAETPIRLDLSDIGFTAPNEAGRRYRHGSLSGYNAGRCRCEYCRRAITEYRSARRATQRPPSRLPKLPDDDDHIGRNLFRRGIWGPACNSAGLQITPRVHDLRHAHASWLLAGGADLQVVKERLGHASIMTTQQYLHTLPEADESAVEAFSRIRDRAPRRSA